jgi:hypothetical protein
MNTFTVISGHFRAQEGIMSKFLGEIEPVHGRWIWPHSSMEPGDWFTVDQMLKDKGRVVNMAHVRGYQLGKRFSTGDDPDRPGFTRVVCNGDAEQFGAMSLGKTEINFPEAMKLIERCYGSSVKAHSMAWQQMPHDRPERTEYKQIEKPKSSTVMVTTNHCTVACEMKEDEIVLRYAPSGCTLHQWLTS